MRPFFILVMIVANIPLEVEARRDMGLGLMDPKKTPFGTTSGRQTPPPFGHTHLFYDLDLHGHDITFMTLSEMFGYIGPLFGHTVNMFIKTVSQPSRSTAHILDITCHR